MWPLGVTVLPALILLLVVPLAVGFTTGADSKNFSKNKTYIGVT
jgi:hypothetical protein